ncbi:MAG: hypothetical protein KJ725_06275 [Gammaproteobacteria bacterium]|nr:hypothetical protein [Gammaproteobacteria bacterium]
MTAAPLELRIFNHSLQHDLNRFLLFLIDQLQNRRDIPVSEILSRLPFGPMAGTTREELLERGKIEVVSGDRLQNNGEEFFGNFEDAKLGEIAVYFPDEIDARFQVSETTFSVSFNPPIECVINALTDLIGNLRRSAYQNLHQINAAENTWTYLLSSQDDANETLSLIIDASEATVKPSTGGYLLPDVWRPSRLLGSCCPGPKDAEVIDTRTKPSRRLPLHIRRLVEPTAHTIEQMVGALNDVFEQSGIRVNAEVASNEALNLPELETIDYPGKVCPELIDRIETVSGSHSGGLCLLDESSEEQDQLYRKREGVPNNEICIYIITEINDPCVEGVIGRALINGPSVMVEADAFLFTLAHEVGHTLGLGHQSPPVSGALMNKELEENPSDTPTFQENERGTILSSRFLK